MADPGAGSWKGLGPSNGRRTKGDRLRPLGREAGLLAAQHCARQPDACREIVDPLDLLLAAALAMTAKALERHRRAERAVGPVPLLLVLGIEVMNGKGISYRRSAALRLSRTACADLRAP